MHAGKNSNLRRYTVEDKLAVIDPGNKHYKNEQNVLRWGKENLKDMGAPLIHLAVAIRLCRYLRTLQAAFNLNLLGVSLADLQRESLQAFVREAARYLKGESKRTRKLDEARIAVIRQNAPGNSVLKIFEQLNNVLRKESPAAGMPEDAELAMLAARVRTLLKTGCERASSHTHTRAQISIRPDGVPSAASRGLEMPAVLSSAISAIPGLVPH